MRKHIPNFITCLNLLIGSVGCIRVIEGRPELAIYFVLAAGFLDFIDGFAARWLRVSSAIGKELDSLADVISFGLLPALFIYKSIESSSYAPYALIGLLVVVFSALRLAKFNVAENQSDQFIGLPTPASAILITSLALLPESLSLTGLGFILISLTTSFLLVSPFTMIALKFKGTSWTPNRWKYILLIGIAILLVIFHLHAFPFIIPFYILISLIGNDKINSVSIK